MHAVLWCCFCGAAGVGMGSMSHKHTVVTPAVFARSSRLTSNMLTVVNTCTCIHPPTVVLLGTSHAQPPKLSLLPPAPCFLGLQYLKSMLSQSCSTRSLGMGSMSHNHTVVHACAHLPSVILLPSMYGGAVRRCHDISLLQQA